MITQENVSLETGHGLILVARGEIEPEPRMPHPRS